MTSLVSWKSSATSKMHGAVRVSTAGAWSYLPMPTQADGRLLSDQGPVFPSRKAKPSPDIKVLSKISSPVQVDGGRLVFGHANQCRSYNGFLDISMLSDKEATGKISQSEPGDGDVVMAIFDGGAMPARVSREERKLVLELPDAIPAGKRCFVITEAAALVSVSYVSQGLDRIRIVPRMALASWLYHVNPSILRPKFKASLGGAGIVITNTASGKSYTAPIMGNSPQDELSSVSHALGMHGLAGVVPKYSLKVLKEPGDGQDHRQQDRILE